MKEVLMKINTHETINQKLCGVVLALDADFSRIELKTDAAMSVDAHGLVHGGFIFGLADYAAMLAVNDPNVVLGGANVKFLKPVKAGETVVAEAKTTEKQGKKHEVSVMVYRNAEAVFTGEFTCFVLDRHVLSQAKD
jgi:uncharacterized protein (TIGR00369 family)